MHRRDFLSLVTALLSGGLAAQALPAKVYRIGWLSTVPPRRTGLGGVRGGAARARLDRGKERRFRVFSFGGTQRSLSRTCCQLVKRNVDIIVAIGTPPAEAARDATTSIPIVFVFVGDPVGAGLVDSPARPGRNLTGLGGFAAGFYTKQLALLKEVVPNASRIGLLMNDTFSLHIAMKGELEVAARKLGVTLIPVP